MAVHLVKLCVGVETVQELKAWQEERLKTLRKAGKRSELCHCTLQTPRRREEILAGGSLYWVIKGFILVRQPIVDLRPDRKDDGTACCGIVLADELVATAAHPRRAFQGWRYLEADEAPRDVRGVSLETGDMPPAMRAALRELRLLDF
jgi:hypothetical protein